MVSFLKKAVFKLYVLFLMAFTVWYGSFMYPLIFGFEGKEEAAESLRQLGRAGTEEEQMFVRLIAEQEQKKTTNLGYKVIEQPYIEGRFHHIGFSIQRDQANVCVRCHGNVPHDQSKEIRSFLNMHTFYLACETCHATPPEGADPWDFRWYNKDTGELTENPRALVDIEKAFLTEGQAGAYPIYGNYGAKVAPGVAVGDKFQLLHGPREMAFVEKYIASEDQLDPERKSQMKKKLHQKVSDSPVECKNCHQEQDQYIPLAQLGYPPSRLNELTNVAVVGMIQKYKEFYMPSLLKPGGFKK